MRLLPFSHGWPERFALFLDEPSQPNVLQEFIDDISNDQTVQGLLGDIYFFHKRRSLFNRLTVLQIALFET